MSNMIFPLLFLAIACLCCGADEIKCPADNEVEFIGSNSTWKDWDRERFIHLSGTLMEDKEPIKACRHEVADSAIPKEFDARTNWPYCSDIISHIRDQSGCNSCWAVATAATISDRICIGSKGTQKVQISALDIMTCLTPGGYNCCDGGDIRKAYEFWMMKGVVSGGDFGDKSTCRPYPLEGWAHESTMQDRRFYLENVENCSMPSYQCERKCSNGKSYLSDKFFAEDYCQVDQNEAAIQREIMTHGSVTASMDIYPCTFPKSALNHDRIYKCDEMDKKGHRRHSVKLFGWGVRYGEKYWLAANSWGSNWGNHGTFKFIRGINDCNIESRVFAGKAKIKRSVV